MKHGIVFEVRLLSVRASPTRLDDSLLFLPESGAMRWRGSTRPVLRAPLSARVCVRRLFALSCCAPRAISLPHACSVSLHNCSLPVCFYLLFALLSFRSTPVVPHKARACMCVCVCCCFLHLSAQLTGSPCRSPPESCPWCLRRDPQWSCSC